MKDLTTEFNAVVMQLPDHAVVQTFIETASKSLYSYCVGVLLGNIAEQATAKILGGRVMGSNQRGYDILLPNGDRVQVKSRLRTTYRTNSQFLKGNVDLYDTWVAASFDEDLSVKVAIMLSASEVRMYGSDSRFTERQLTELLKREINCP